MAKFKYQLFDIVFLITDPEQLPRIVCARIERPGCLLYDLSKGVETSCHYEQELSPDIDELMKLNARHGED